MFGHLETRFGSFSLQLFLHTRMHAHARTRMHAPRHPPANIKNEAVSGQLGLSQEAVGNCATCSSEDRPRRGGGGGAKEGDGAGRKAFEPPTT